MGGVLKASDFPISAFGKTAELFRQNDKRFGETNPYVYFVNEENQGAKYYLGRQTITGTKTPITDDILARQLDGRTVGIIDKSYGKERLVYRFDLLNKEEMDKYHDFLKKKFKKNDVEYKWLAMHTQVGGQEMKKRIKEYKITDFVKQKRDESSGDYAERVSRLADVSFVTQKLQSFFRKSGIGLHKLSWRDQLLIADIAHAGEEEERLQSFIEKYGVNGLRTFLSLEYGREIGNDIFTLGEQLPKNEAEAIFKRYNDVVDGVSDLNNLILKDTENKAEILMEAEDNLLRRARKILEDFAEAQKQASAQGTVLDAEDIVEQLGRISKENQTILATFKALQNKDPWLTFENFKDVQFDGERVGDLDRKDIVTMKKIYADNYKLTPKFQKRLLANFDKILENPEQIIQITRFKGEVVGFYLYTGREKGGLDFRCFNMDPTYAGGGFGKAMMNQELRDRSIDNLIHATCTAEMPISAGYIESGFVGVGYGHTDEINYLDIVRCDQRDFFPTKEPWTREEIENLIKNDNKYEDERYLIVSEEEVGDLPFDFAGEKTGDKVLVLTRYLLPEKNGNKKRYILVFEKTDPKILRDYQNPNVPRRSYIIV